MSVVTHVHVDGHYNPDAEILNSQPKQATAGNSFLFGQILIYNEVANRWDKAAAGASGRFGTCTNPDFLSLSTNELTGATTATRGVGENATACSVLVDGTVEKKAEGAILPGSYVKVGTTDPNEVQQFVEQPTPDNIGLAVGTYVGNLTQHHNANDPIPTAADGDSVLIRIRSKDVV